MGSVVVESAVQPDIEYTPNWHKFQQRTQQRKTAEQLSNSVPHGYPSQLDADLVWEGEELAKQYDWTFQLNSEQVEEIEQALEHFQSLKLVLGNISQATFPLPTLHDHLRAISREIHYGHGFKVVRGVPVDRHSREENIIIYAGVSSHIAAIRGRQDSNYEGRPAAVVITHIKDLSTTSLQSSVGSPAYTTDKQVFHTDSGDIVSLFALSAAAEGGTSRLASTWRVYNELAATRPDLIHTLSQDWQFDTFGNTSAGYTSRPLLYHQAATVNTPERVVLQYARRYFTGFGALPRSQKIPPISEAQAEALDMLHFLGEKFNIGLDFQKGDIQYVNNLAVFHARDGFTDTTDQQRHLLRLWLRDPELAWATPSPLQDNWDKLYKDVEPEQQVFPLEPYVRSASNGGANRTPDLKHVS